MAAAAAAAAQKPSSLPVQVYAPAAACASFQLLRQHNMLHSVMNRAAQKPAFYLCGCVLSEPLVHALNCQLELLQQTSRSYMKERSPTCAGVCFLSRMCMSMRPLLYQLQHKALGSQCVNTMLVPANTAYLCRCMLPQPLVRVICG
jgi:hypothetical protein